MGRSFIIVTTKTFRYGLGIVAEEYVEGQMIDIEVELTAYHQVENSYSNFNQNRSHCCIYFVLVEHLYSHSRRGILSSDFVRTTQNDDRPSR